MPFLAIALTLAVGIGIGTIVSDGVFSAEVQELRVSGGGEPLVMDEEAGLLNGFKRVAETVEPAVVNISTTAVVRQRAAVPPGGDTPGPFGDDFWERFFGPMVPQERALRSLGSGVIVDSDGYVLTNNHVIARADKIEVKLADGSTHIARVIGQDPESDIAVLKIDAGSPLPFAKVGDTSRMEVGDWVLAIGSPFGFDQTVTAGIISATHRVVDPRLIGTNPFGDYVQTDASINPGNSGGPLVNMRGEVIGINTWISTTSGQSAGVGFAIPSGVFVNAYNQLVTTGEIERGWLGVSMNQIPLTPELAEFFGVAGGNPPAKDGDGVLVTETVNERGEPSASGPAYEAGIRAEDVIVQIGGREIEGLFDLRSAVASTPPGETVPVTVVRKGQVLTFDIELAKRTFGLQRPEEDESLSFEERHERDRPREIGLEFHTLLPREAEQLGIEAQGVLIDSVGPASRADEAGLRQNQVITHVNGEAVTSGQEFKNKIESLSSGAAVVLRGIDPGDPRNPEDEQIFYTSFVKP